MWSVLVAALARLWPLSTPERPPLRRALGFLEWEIAPADLQGASFVTGGLLGLASVCTNALVGGTAGLVVAVCCLVAGAFALATGRLVELLARARRASALGAAPALLTRATLRMRLRPAPEAAARFASETAEGALARSLAGHVLRTANGPESGLRSFGREWALWFPELERACSLVESAGRQPAGDRDATLDSARRAVLDGAHDRMAAFAAAISGPVTALYAFGVLLPLSLVALLPALDAAGVATSLSLVVVVYDVCLPAIVLGASVWLLAKRPVAFPPTVIRRSHPDVWTTRWQAIGAGLVAGGVAWWAVRTALPGWLAVLAAVGCGVGSTLVVAFYPMQSVRSEVRDVETGLADALSLVGRQVERGVATETALDRVAGEIPGATGDVFDAATRRQRRLGVDIETAFTGPDGALSTVPSDRLASGAAMLALSAREGQPAGSALAALGDHLDTLDEVERETRRAVERVTNTLSTTASVFGPLVGGATVALSAALGQGGLLGGTTPVSAIGLAVGWYVLVLAAVLTVLATGLTRGLDRSLVGYRVGLALVTATVTYVTAFVGAGLFV